MEVIDYWSDHPTSRTLTDQRTLQAMQKEDTNVIQKHMQVQLYFIVVMVI